MSGEHQKSVCVCVCIRARTPVNVCIYVYMDLFLLLSSFSISLAHRHGIVNVTSLIGHSIGLHVPFVVLLALSRENSWNAPRCQRKQCSPKQLGRMNRTESERFRFYLASRDMNKRLLSSWRPPSLPRKNKNIESIFAAELRAIYELLN